MHLKSKIQIVPLLRSRPKTITISKQQTVEELQHRINMQSLYNNTAIELNISHNNVSQMPKIPSRMTSLLATHGKFSQIECLVGEHLIHIDLSHNHLKQVPRLSCPNLTVLLLHYNDIQIVDRSLITHQNLVHLNLLHNRLRSFYGRVLQLPCRLDIQLLHFIDPNEIRPAQAYHSLQDLMQKQWKSKLDHWQLQRMMLLAVDMEYCQMLHYLVTQKGEYNIKWLKHAQTNKLDISLRYLLELMRVKEGFIEERIRFLMVSLFEPCRLKQQLNLQMLIESLNQRNKVDPSKSQQFLHFTYSYLNSLINLNNIDMLFKKSSAVTLKQILHFQDVTRYARYIATSLIDDVIYKDDPLLLQRLFELEEFKQEVLVTGGNGGSRVCRLLKKLDPNDKLYKHVVKEQKNNFKNLLERKTLNFREYDMNTPVGRGARHNLLKPVKYPAYMEEFERIVGTDRNSVSPSVSPCKNMHSSVILSKPNNQKQNRPSFQPLSKQISDRLKMSTVSSSRTDAMSMSAMVMRRYAR